MMKNARNIVIDPVRNLIAVSSRNGTLIFNRTDSGNVKPRAIIKGIGGKFRLIPSKGWIVGTGQDAAGKEGIGVWSITDNGDVLPFYLLTNPNGGLGGNDIALNPKEKEVFLGDRVSVTVYSFPEIF